MNLPGKRILLGTAVAAAALGVGGLAYATGGEPVPSEGYVTIEDGATTPSPGTGSEQRDGLDCPDKDGTGQGQAQPERTQPEQTPPQPEQGENDPQGQA